jgi:hypothetical protein
LTWIRLGDTNNSLFHIRANARQHCNHIHCHVHESTPHFTQEAKALALEDFYSTR